MATVEPELVASELVELEVTVGFLEEVGLLVEGLLEVGLLEDGLLEGSSGTELIVGVVGFSVIEELTGACCSYLLEAPSTIFGSTISETVSPFEEVSPCQLKVQLAGDCDNCGICVPACIYDALSCEKGTLSILPEKCTGCGMCVELCPHQALQLGW